ARAQPFQAPERIIAMLQDYKHRNCIKVAGHLLEFGEHLNAGAGPASVGAIHSDGVEPKHSAHLQKLAEAAAEIEHPPDAKFLEPEHVLHVRRRRRAARAMLRFELTDRLLAHPARET